MTFYDDWLGMWSQATEEKQAARKVTHEEDIARHARRIVFLDPEHGSRCASAQHDLRSGSVDSGARQASWR